MGAAARRCEGDNWADRQILILSACLSIQLSHASLQSARDYRGLCLLAREGLECTNVLFRPIPPLHRFLCHLCSPCNQTCGPISGAYVNKNFSLSSNYGLVAHKDPRK